MTHQSPLARLLPTKASPEELDEIKRAGWCERGILVVDIHDSRLTWPEKESIRQIGDRIYGDFDKKGGE